MIIKDKDGDLCIYVGGHIQWTDEEDSWCDLYTDGWYDYGIAQHGLFDPDFYIHMMLPTEFLMGELT